jgi:hypothetical protein
MCLADLAANHALSSPSVAEPILPSASVTEPLKPSESANPTAPAQGLAADDDVLEPVDPAALAKIDAALKEAGVNMTTVDAELSGRRRNKLRKTRNPVDRALRAETLGFGFSGSGFLVSASGTVSRVYMTIVLHVI